MLLQEINEKSNEVFIVGIKAYLKTCTIQLLFLFLEFYHLQKFTPLLPFVIVKIDQRFYSTPSITDVPQSSDNCVLVLSPHV